MWDCLPCTFWGEHSLLIDSSSLTCSVNSQCRRLPRRAPRRPSRSRRPPRRRPRRPRRRRRRPRRRSERGFIQPPGLDPHRRLSAPPSFIALPEPPFTQPPNLPRCHAFGLVVHLSWRSTWPTLARLTKADSTRRFSRAVPHRGTNRAFRCLTSEFKWDRVFSTKYGRQRRHSR